MATIGVAAVPSLFLSLFGTLIWMDGDGRLWTPRKILPYFKYLESQQWMIWTALDEAMAASGSAKQTFWRKIVDHLGEPSVAHSNVEIVSGC